MCLHPVSVKGNIFPCGKCVECKIKKSTEWAYRIMHEASHYEDNCFITLTYNEVNLPPGGGLSRRDLTLFLKRLRKKLGKFRYFYCGEYGSKGRCHYHLILFGIKFDDMYYFTTDKKGARLYRSATLEKLWDKGFSSIGLLSFDSAKYCAKYMQKSHDIGDKAKPFIGMSLKPGIGFDSIHIDMLKTDKVYHNGKYISTPRYYLKVLERTFPTYVEVIKEKRSKKVSNEAYTDIWLEDLERRQKKFQKKFGFSIDKPKKKVYNVKQIELCAKDTNFCE